MSSQPSASAQGASWPVAPQIDGEAMLTIFVHKSITYADTSSIPSSLYCDGSMLAILGRAILEASYTFILVNKRMKADEIETKRAELPELVEQWVKEYKWRGKVRHAVDVDLEQVMETRFLMDAYVGALFIGKNFEAVTKWIQALVAATNRKASP